MEAGVSPANEQVFIDNLPLINDAIRMVCRRFGCSVDEAEEFAAHARLKFIEGDYAVLGKYAGRCGLRIRLR